MCCFKDSLGCPDLPLFDSLILLQEVVYYASSEEKNIKLIKD